jgi:CPA1 family monovalent cation:H+ antiporter
MIQHVEVQVLVLLLIASFVAMLARRYKQPYTLALVVAGLVLGLIEIEPLEGLHLSGDLLLLLFLPALLFEAAFHIDFKAFRSNLVPILLLAVPGVLVAVGVTASLLYFSLGVAGLADGFGWSHAFLFAAVIAATDPISVLALFRELGVARRLYLLVEGESLLNDGVAVVLFTIIATVLGLHLGHGEVVELHGAGEIAAYSLRTFLWMAGGGVLMGLVVGGSMSALTRQIDDHLIEITLTTLVAYGAFLLAEQVHASGVLSTVTAGIVMGSVGRKYGMSPSTRLAVVDHWEYMAFLANSFIFLLVGLELEPGVLLGAAPAILVSFAMVLLARTFVVHSFVGISNRFSNPIPMSWRHTMVWGGLRGSLSMVLIISIPADFEGRSVLVGLVFGVVAASLFLQGMTVGPLMRRMGLLVGGSGNRAAYEAERGRALAAQHAIDALSELESHGQLDRVAVEKLRVWYRDRFARAESAALNAGGVDRQEDELLEGVRLLIDVEREAIRHAAHVGVVSRSVAGKLAAELDERITRLEEAQHHGDQDLSEALDALFSGDDGKS